VYKQKKLKKENILNRASLLYNHKNLSQGSLTIPFGDLTISIELILNS
jgi:hypothetical protein